MKKWQKILITVLCVAAVFAVGITAGYKVYLEPKVEEKIEQAAEKVEAVVNDDDIQKQIDDFAQSMIDDGVISLKDMPTYNRLKLENEEKRREAQTVLNQTPKPKVKQETGEDAFQKPAAISTPRPETVPVQTTQPKSDLVQGQKKTMYQKLKEAMTADEFSFALSMYSKVDVGYAQSLLASDKAAAKEYIYSRVSPSEISRALEIYAKYSYLLR